MSGRLARVALVVVDWLVIFALLFALLVVLTGLVAGGQLESDSILGTLLGPAMMLLAALLATLINRPLRRRLLAPASPTAEPAPVSEPAEYRPAPEPIKPVPADEPRRRRFSPWRDLAGALVVLLVAVPICLVLPYPGRGPREPVTNTAPLVDESPAELTVVPSVSPPRPPLAAASPSPSPVAGSDCVANCDRVVLFADDFNSSAAGQLQKSSPLPAYYELGYDAGEYFIRKIAPTWPQSPGVAVPGRYTDTSVQVDARLVGPTEQRSLVIVCRDQGTSDSNYRLMIDPSRGAVSLNRWDAGRQVQLTEWQVSPAIRTGNEVNHLELICNGSQIAALVNGIQVAAVSDATYNQGQILLLVGHAASTPSTVEGRFDNLLVTRP